MIALEDVENMLTNKYVSDQQERRIAQALGWQVVRGSGARPHNPGDVISEQWLGECKTHVTAGQKIVFMRSVWDKICKEAASKRRFPCLIVDDGTQSLNRTWVMFPYMSNRIEDAETVTAFPNFLKSISFHHSEMMTRYCLSTERRGPLVYTCAGIRNVGIVPFDAFCDAFGGR